ncbi:hypothetical protein [Lysobacter claricitrinus]|uniref:hypothetical protein n=1 Tax=Lysobacter claricitrinus TaxID=3367728 RepID=UPI0037DAB976
MIRKAKAVVVFLLLAIVATAAAASPNGERLVGALDGSWEGSLTLSEAPRDVMDLRVDLKGDEAHVWIRENEEWIEAKPGMFHVNRTLTNAVIYATDSASDEDGTWVESWSIVASPRSEEELLIAWARVVNNLDLPLENVSSKFALHADAVLRRVAGS